MGEASKSGRSRLNKRFQPVSGLLNEKPKEATPTTPPLSALLSPEALRKLDQKNGILHLISGTTAKGQSFYAYVSVRPSLYLEFCQKLEEAATIDVDYYGKVLHKGFGLTPSEDVARYMEEKFGFEPDFGEKMKAAFEAATSA